MQQLDWFRILASPCRALFAEGRILPGGEDLFIKAFAPLFANRSAGGAVDVGT